MNRFRLAQLKSATPTRWGVVLGILLGSLTGRPADPPPAPPFAELFGVIRSNLTSVTPAELNRAAVRGLLDQLRPRALLLPETPAPEPATNLIVAATLYEEHFAHLRVGRFAPGLAEEFARRLTELTRGRDREGLVLDLRFAAGWEYAEAARLADFFLNRKVPLLDWGGGMKEASPEGRYFSAPVTVLINRRTSGAAAALAGILQRAHAALLIGERTEGDAFAFREFRLSDGSRLRLAEGRVRLGDGKELPEAGIAPDLEVSVPLDEQRAYLKDPCVALANATNPASRTPRDAGRRLTEADLVRLHDRGFTRPGAGPLPENVLTNVPDAKAESPPVITDPMLARALDLLKGLAIVRAARK